MSESNQFSNVKEKIYQDKGDLAKFSKALGTAASGVQVLGAAIAATTALGALMKDNLGADFAALEGAAKRFGAEVFESVEKPMRSATQVMTAMLQGMTGVLSSNELMEQIRDHRTEIQKMSDAYEMQKIASDAAGLGEAAQIDYAKELFVALKCKAKSPAGRRVNSTPFVRQYDILNNKWGVLLCQKEYQTSDIHQNLSNWL